MLTQKQIVGWILMPGSTMTFLLGMYLIAVGNCTQGCATGEPVGGGIIGASIVWFVIGAVLAFND